MIFRHTCLDGEDRLGLETDCPKCRALLLEAFRAPADLPVRPDPLQQAMDRHPSGRLPHLSVPADSARTIDLHPFTEEQQNPRHITEHGTDPDPDQPGGDWFVRCSCGWFESGHYARDGVGERTANRLAALKAGNHRRAPESGDEQ